MAVVLSQANFRLPIVPQHAVNNAVDKMIIKPFCLPQDTFLNEAQSLRYRSTFRVSNSNMYLHPIELQLRECEVNKGTGTFGHDAATLILLNEPIADFSRAVAPIDVRETDNTYYLPIIPDAAVKPIVLCVLIERRLNEVTSILRSFGRTYPWQPFVQIVTCCISKREKFLGVS